METTGLSMDVHRQRLLDFVKSHDEKDFVLACFNLPEIVTFDIVPTRTDLVFMDQRNPRAFRSFHAWVSEWVVPTTDGEFDEMNVCSADDRIVVPLKSICNGTYDPSNEQARDNFASMDEESDEEEDLYEEDTPGVSASPTTANEEEEEEEEEEEVDVEEDAYVVHNYNPNMSAQDKLRLLESSNIFAKCVFVFSAVVTMAAQAGFQVAWAYEQCNKTVAMFLVCIARHIHRTPTIIVVAEAKANAGSKAGGVTAKLEGFARVLPEDMRPTFRFLSGEKRHWEPLMKKGNDAAEGFLVMFKEGRVVPVIQAHSCVLENMRKYLEHHGVKGVKVLLDEGDKVLLARKKEEEEAIANTVSRKRGRTTNGSTATRHHTSDVKYNVNLKALLSVGSTVPNRPLGPNAHCTGLVIVSATHFATMQWLEEDVSPDTMMQAHMADDVRIRGIGYSTGEQLKLHVAMEKNYTSKDRHGCDGEEVRAMFNAFREDYKNPAKRGALMMAAMGSAIFSNGKQTQSTNLKYAATSIEQCPEAVVIVYSSVALMVTTQALMMKGKEVVSLAPEMLGGRRRVRSRRAATADGAQCTLENLWVDGHPGFFDAKAFAREDVVRLLSYNNYEDPDELLLHIIQRRNHHSSANEDEEPCTLGSVLDIVDNMGPSGLRTPIICLGYELLIRSISVRSTDRVITHMVINVGDNKLTSDVRQMLMRSAGYNADNVRLLNGFQEVKVCMTRKDFDCSMTLPTMLKRVLTPFVGAPRAVREWRKNGEEYTYFRKELEAVINPDRYHTVVESSCRNRLFDGPGIFCEWDGPKKQKTLKTLLHSGKVVPGCDKVAPSEFKIGKSVPVTIQLSESSASELKEAYDAELRDKKLRSNAHTFTTICPETAVKCTEALFATQEFTALRQVDRVFDVVLCNGGAVEMRTLKNAVNKRSKIMPIRPLHYLPTRTDRVIRSVHVDVGEWKVYVVDGGVSVEGRDDEEDAQEAVRVVEPTVDTTIPALDFGSHLFTVDIPDGIFDIGSGDMARSFQIGMDALGAGHTLRALVERWGVSRFEVVGHDSVEGLHANGVLVIEYQPGTNVVKVDVEGRSECDGMFTRGAMRRPIKLKHTALLIVIKSMARRGGHFTNAQVCGWVGTDGHGTVITSMRNARLCDFAGRKGSGNYSWTCDFTTPSSILDDVACEVKHHNVARRNAARA